MISRVALCTYIQLDEFLTSDLFPAFSADGVNDSHPIVETVSNPNEINELFDSISYSKVGGYPSLRNFSRTPLK